MDGVQNVPRAGIIELVFGEPDPALPPVTEIRRACAAALAEGAKRLGAALGSFSAGR